MLFDVSYEITALLMFFVVLAHVRLSNSVRTFANRYFSAFVWCGVATIVADIVSAFTITAAGRLSDILVILTVEVLYLLQLTMLYMVFLYVLSLHDALNRKGLPLIVVASVPFAGMLLFTIANLWTGSVVYLDAAGNYCHGPWYYLNYVYAIIYLSASVADVYLHRKSIPRQHRYAVLEFVLLCCLAVVIQMHFTRLQLIGVGVAASMTVMLLTINNPYQKMDPLTGLFDAASLRETLQDSFHRGEAPALIVVACDNLKRINLVFGMEAGNTFLKTLAGRLAGVARRESTYRFVSDCFVLACRPGEYEALLGRTQALFEQPAVVRGVKVPVSACICGIPEPEFLRTPDRVMGFIDYVIDRAKKQGAGTVLRADKYVQADYERSQAIEAYLDVAVKENLFEVFYQPVYSVAEGRFVSAEALVRLRHPVYGALSPAEFIPIAESSGEISAVERCIFRRGCRFLSAHPELWQTLNTVKFNVSPATFLSANSAREVLAQLAESGLAPQHLQFEVTETAATSYSDELEQWAKRVKAAGAGLCLDDFGSGYANLDRVLKLPFDVIKLDRSMLLEATAGHRAAVLYRSVAEMMLRLGFDVVAEGAETPAEVGFLQQIGVPHIQGFYYAKPMREEAFLECVTQSKKR